MAGRQLASLVLSDEERAELKVVGERGARRRRRWRCGRGSCWPVRKAAQNKEVAAELRIGQGDGRQMAPALCRAARGRPARRAASRRAAHDRRCPDRSGDRADPGEPARGCHPLEFARHGEGQRPVGLERAAHLARLRPAAAPDGDLQALHRSGLRGQGARRGRPLCLAAGSMPSCCASTRSPRSRRSTAASRCCRCGPASRRGAATTTRATARPRCSPPSTSPPAR